MTREEAKATINEILGCFGNKAADGEYELTQLDAEDMREAIERLSVVECEDAISRADAIGLFKDDVAAVNELMQLESVHPKVCECEDCISRKSVIDVLIRNRVHFCDMVRITSELKELPPVIPKVAEREDAISTSVLEDIKAEIEREYLSEGHLTDYWDGIDKALEIIDKHISGSEKPNNCEDAISRAEAIKAMESLEKSDIEAYGCPIPEGFDGKRAIEALRKLPPVTPKLAECEDCISRQAVLEPYKPLYDTDTICIRVLRKNIEQIPSVTPKQKMGRWIMPVQDDGMSDPIYYQVRCSECDFDLDPQTWHMELHQYGADKYCPNCGAKMSENPTGSESEDTE